MNLQAEINKKNRKLARAGFAQATKDGFVAFGGFVCSTARGIKRCTVAAVKGIGKGFVFIGNAITDKVDELKEKIRPEVYVNYLKLTKNYKEKIGTVEKVPNSSKYVAYTPDGPIVGSPNGSSFIGYAKAKVGFREKYLFTALNETYREPIETPMSDYPGYRLIEGVTQTSSGRFVKQYIRQADGESLSQDECKIVERTYDLKKRFNEAFKTYAHVNIQSNEVER